MSTPLQLDGQDLELAKARLRLMYAKPEHPYYIMAPAYRETSSGIVALHYLCHMLNLSGREAYICRTETVNPELKTPLLDSAIAVRHLSEGKTPIAIYPEVVEGNPLGCAVVSRFLLNFEGAISGRGMQARSDDLLFFYAAPLAERLGLSEFDLLCLPAIDIGLFSPPPAGAVREGRYLYQNRHPLEQIDYTQLPDDIRLLSVANPLSLSELASLLRKAEVLYSHEWSMTCVMAVLCGCPVLFIPGHGIDEQFLNLGFFGNVGFAMLDQPQALEQARSTLPQALTQYVQRTAGFWQQLDVFIAKTQAAAERETQGNRRGALDWLRQRYPQPTPLQLIQQRLASPAAPTLAIVVRDGADPQALARTLQSLQQSLYQRYTVHVLGNSRPSQAQVDWLEGGVEQAVPLINGLLERSDCQWLMIVDAGETFTPCGLLAAALKLLDGDPSCLAMYADEAVQVKGGLVDIALRPDLDLDLLLAFPASLSRHWCYRREALLQQHGFAPEGGRAFELHAQLRLIQAHGQAAVEHVSDALLVANAVRAQICADEHAVITDHLRTSGYPQAQVIDLPGAPGRYRIDYGHQQDATVSVLIYLEGSLLAFQRCLESLLMHTTHNAYEVILIDPGSDDPDLLAWLQMVSQMDEARFAVFQFMPGQSRAAMCNAAAQEARGDYLVLLDAASAVLEPDWLQALLNHAQRAEVGAVGGKLFDREGSIQQAALLLGASASIGQLFRGMPAQDAGYMGRLGLEQRCAALGGKCLMIRRELFLQAAGLDVDPLLAPWAEADLCLRLHQGGYVNVWTPHARLLQDARGQRRPSAEQEDALYARWLPLLARDPGYNRNFSLRDGEAFALQDNALCWSPSADALPKVLACLGEQQPGSATRLLEPLTALERAGQIEAAATTGWLSAVEIERFSPATVVMQRPLDDDGLLALRRLRAFSTAFKVYDLDGYLPAMDLAIGMNAEQLLERLQQGMLQADRVMVASPMLAELLQGQHEDVCLLQSALPTSWGRLSAQRGVADKPRVGWLGGKDSGLLSEVLPALANEVQWVVLGDCPASLQPLLAERHPAPQWNDLGPALAALDLDLALVPMSDSLSNHCSADLRVLQHAACGHPLICSRSPGLVGSDVLPLSRVDNTANDWIRAIRLHLEDPQASAALGEELRNQVRHNWLLQGERLQAWRRAWLPG
ncbi:glycosyltransferase [Pseudomonas urmiensis]|uniref:Glycosyltransferase n=1 Tax=Pseudomonas urmiensis TaxID=2745493 RepID=A0A923G1H8_9PSED|nr:glycosyltransferase [Pseudomonas urmiensis]MBV4535150.1 glycosyltransferase [Pseudomonas urmiensis]